MWDWLLLQLLPRPPWPSNHYFATSPFHSGCPSPPLLLVWMNVYSLTPWLSDFHTVQFSGSYGYFLFLNLLLSFFSLCKEVKCIYLLMPPSWPEVQNFLKYISTSTFYCIQDDKSISIRFVDLWHAFDLQVPNLWAYDRREALGVTWLPVMAFGTGRTPFHTALGDHPAPRDHHTHRNEEQNVVLNINGIWSYFQT